MYLPSKIIVREVGPRDGLQAESCFVETSRKVDLINRLWECGLKMIESTSFVSPQAIPQLQDAEAVIAGINRPPGSTVSALVGNARGVERALKAGVDEVQVVISASEAHNRRNVKMSIEESLRQLEQAAEKAWSSGLVIRAAIATAFGCPFEGRITYSRIQEMTKALQAMGIKQITLADTAGLGNPLQVYSLVNSFRDDFPELEVALHFHDTRGLGLANSLAGLQAGVTVLEASVGGMGGCPFIPQATGNIATEDLVFMCESMDIATGVDLDRLLETAKWLEEVLGHALPGRLLQLQRTGKVCNC